MPLTPEKRAIVIRRLQKLAWLLDAQFALPFTKDRARFGIDAIVGLVPVVGDGLMAIVSLYIVCQAWRLGTPFRTLLKMVGWVMIDFISGTLPLGGDFADALLKVNIRNLRMIGIEARPAPTDITR